MALARVAVSRLLPSPIPLSFLLRQQILPSQLLLLEQQMMNLLCWRQERSLPVPPPSPCSRAAWDMGTLLEGSSESPFYPHHHPTGFLGSDSEAQRYVAKSWWMSSCHLKGVLQKAELRNTSPGDGRAGSSCPLSLQNTSGASVRFPETIPGSFTQRGAVSGLLFPLLLRHSTRGPWSQGLTWLLTRAALLLNEQKENK